MGAHGPPSIRHSSCHAEPGRLKVQRKCSRAAHERKTFSGQVYIGIVNNHSRRLLYGYAACDS